MICIDLSVTIYNLFADLIQILYQFIVLFLPRKRLHAQDMIFELV